MEKEKTVLFSILTPVYNVELYIDACIRSVLCQTYRNFEFILVDDGSTDNSGLICERYAAADNRIKIYHKPNGGLLHTRRYALEKACGDYVVFLDSDDSLEPNALETIYHAVLTYAPDCVVYGMNRVLQGEVLSHDTEPNVGCITDKRTLYRKVFSSNSYNSLCRKAVKLSVFQRKDYSGYYGICRGEDLLQSLEILKNSRSVVFLDKNLYNYTMNPNSITHTNTYEQYHLDFTVREEVLKFLQEENVFTDDDYKDYRAYCIRLFVDNLFIISAFRTTASNKVKQLAELKNTAYYQNFLNVKAYNRAVVGAKSLFFDLYQKGYYRIMLGIMQTCDKLRRIHR